MEAPLEMRVINEAVKSVEESSLKSEATASIPASVEASMNDAQAAVTSTSSALLSVNSATTFTAPVIEVSLDNSKQDVAVAETAKIATGTVNIVTMPE